MQNNVIMFGGKPLDDWQEDNTEAFNGIDITGQEGEELGIFTPAQQQQTQDTFDSQPKIEEEEHKQKHYEKLSVGGTLKDVGKTVGNEAAKILLNKNAEKKYLNYESKTRIAEASKYFYRYGVSTAALMLTGNYVGGAVRAYGATKRIRELNKAGKLLQNVLGFGSLIKPKANANKWVKVGAWLFNEGFSGMLADNIAQWQLYDKEEGHLVDTLGATNNKALGWLQSQEDDTDFEAKVKNTIENSIVGFPFGWGIGGIKAGVKHMRAMRALSKAQTKEEAEKILPSAMRAEKDLQNTLSTSELYDRVQKTIQDCESKGEDAEQFIIDNFAPEEVDKARDMFKIINSGEECFIHSDGTFDIKVNKWEDAVKVSQEEYEKQLKAQDFDKESLTYQEGRTGLAHKDKAVQDTWEQRGWVDTDKKSLVKYNTHGQKVGINQTAANNIAKNYCDKWAIDNNVKVVVMKGYEKASGVKATTEMATSKGKVKKSIQNKIDKKKLEIQLLEDKLTDAEGLNEPVLEDIDILKEKLRIAKNELKDITQPTIQKNITITIDADCQNPHTVLRDELEHVRDMAKGTIPKDADKVGSGVHFSRYQGDNEAQVAGGYVYHKAQGKQKALGIQQEIDNNLNTKSQNFDSWYNDKTATSTIGDMINDEAFSSQGLLDDVLEVEVRHLGDKTLDTPLMKTHTLGGYTTIENGQVVIYTNSNLAKDKIEENLYHELQHARDLKIAYGLTEATEKEVLKAQQKIAEVEALYKAGDYEGYKKSAYEQSADLSKEYLKKVKKDYYENKLFSRDGKSSDAIPVVDEGYNKTLDGNRGVEQRPSGEESVRNSSSKIQADGRGTGKEHLDSKAAEEQANKIVNGDFEANTYKDIDNVITALAKEDKVNVSGYDWEALAKDSDEAWNNLAKDIENFSEEETKELFNETKDSVVLLTRKQAIAERLQHLLIDKISQCTDAKQLVKYHNQIELLEQYRKGISSGFGVGLENQKFLNKVVEAYGSSKYSQLVKDGIADLANILKTKLDNIKLNFTEGNFIDFKKEVYNILGTERPELMTVITGDADFNAIFEDGLKNMYQSGNFDINQFTQTIMACFSANAAKEAKEASKLAMTPAQKLKTTLNFRDKVASYYVHNLLSSPKTGVVNVISGLFNTLYFPARKLLAGVIDPLMSKEDKEAMFREGFNTYAHLVENMKESWQLCCKAFQEGEGKLSTINEIKNTGDNGQGLNTWSLFDSLGSTIENIHSFMTRCLGASDEFLSQLNYRSIVRSQIDNQLARFEQAAGKLSAENYQKMSDNLFRLSFDSTGKPTNINAFNEAKAILFQNPLSGKIQTYQGRYIDIKTGKLLEKGEQATKSWAMSLGELISNSANKNLVTKLIFPFVKTGTNILEGNLEHNIWYCLASKQFRAILTSNTKEGALLRSQCAFGAFSFVFGATLAVNGLVTGSLPTDAKERKALLATGWKPYSVKIGNNYVSYVGFEPLHTILGFSADCIQLASSITHKDDEENFNKYFIQAGAAFVNNFLDKAAFSTGTKSLALVFNLTEENQADLPALLANIGSGLLPATSAVKWASTLGTREQKKPETLYQRIMDRYGNHGLGEYRRNCFGEKVNITNAIITNITQTGHESEDIELARLAQEGWKPSDISDVISGYGFALKDFKDVITGKTGHELMMEKIEESDLREKVRELVESDDYQNCIEDGINNERTKALGFKFTVHDNTKTNMLNDLFREYYQEARNQVIDEYPDLVNRKGMTIIQAQENADLAKESQLNGEDLEELNRDKIMEL